MEEMHAEEGVSLYHEVYYPRSRMFARSIISSETGIRC